MNSVAIIPPSADWGVLFASAVLQALRRQHGSKIALSVCGVSWLDEAVQNILPGRPALLTMQEMVARRFDKVISLTDSATNASTAAMVGAHGIVHAGGKFLESSNSYSGLMSCYLGDGHDAFSVLGRFLGMDTRALPSFFPTFDPKMHDRQGVSIKDDALRLAVKSRFFDTGRLWHVPLRKSIAKRIEESRTVSALVTDDPICAWGCATGGGKSILLRRRTYICPSFSVQNMVEEEFIDSYDQQFSA